MFENEKFVLCKMRNLLDFNKKQCCKTYFFFWLSQKFAVNLQQLIKQHNLFFTL